MKIKTSDLSGIALDWAVAKVEDSTTEWRTSHQPGYKPKTYSSDWSQGGLIIEREMILIEPLKHRDSKVSWIGVNYFEDISCHGETPLIAAMRCYVASKLGDEVDIPEELISHVE